MRDFEKDQAILEEKRKNKTLLRFEEIY